MIIKEFVKLSGDANYVPVKYAVMEVTVGGTAIATFLWLKVAGYGMDTEPHYSDYIHSIIDASFTGVAPVGLVGTMSAYSVVALSAVEAYKSQYSNHEGPYQIG